MQQFEVEFAKLSVICDSTADCMVTASRDHKQTTRFPYTQLKVTDKKLAGFGSLHG